MPDPSTCPPGSRPVESWCWVMVRGEAEGRGTARKPFHRHCAWCGAWLLWQAVVGGASCTRRGRQRCGMHAVPDGALFPLASSATLPPALLLQPSHPLPPAPQDFHGFSIRDCDPRLAKIFLNLSAAHYPERLGTFFIVSAPTVRTYSKPPCVVASSCQGLAGGGVFALPWPGVCAHSPQNCCNFRLPALTTRENAWADNQPNPPVPASRCRCSTRCGAPSPTSSTPSPSRRWAVAKAPC